MNRRLALVLVLAAVPALAQDARQIVLYYELQALAHGFSGMPLAYEFPFGIAAILVPVILGAALVSAIVPAESAVRRSLVEALEYE